MTQFLPRGSFRSALVLAALLAPLATTDALLARDAEVEIRSVISGG